MSAAELAGRTVLVVGGLGTIGAATAAAVRAAGGEALICDRDAGADPAVIPLDATDAAAVEAVLAPLDGRVTDVVVTVGALETGPVRDLDPLRAAEVVAVNLLAPLAVLSRGVRILPRGGTVTLLSSQAAQHGPADWGLYSATKSALCRIVEAAAKEEGPRGIRVNAVCPGSVDSPMMDRAIDEEAARSGTTAAAVRARYVASSPQGRLVTAAEIADAIVFLVSPRSGFISGQSLVVDAGEGPG